MWGCFGVLNCAYDTAVGVNLQCKVKGSLFLQIFFVCALYYHERHVCCRIIESGSERCGMTLPDKLVVMTFDDGVKSPPRFFERCMRVLIDQRYTVISMRDLANYVEV